MEENQIKVIIEIYRNGIDSKKLKKIKDAIISRESSYPPTSNIIEYLLEEYFIHSKKFHKDHTKDQLELVLNYFCKYKNNAIEYNESKKKYIFNKMDIDIKNEEEILNILSIYDNELKNI
jgi:hypothetical protein